MLPHANSFSISSLSLFRNLLIQLFSTTILWVHFIKLSTEHISNISFATPKGFRDKIQVKMNCSILFAESHNMIGMPESSILLLLKTEFLTWKSCNTLWKKSMHEHMWLIFVVPTCNYLFDFFLKSWLWKPLTYMLFMWVSSSRHHKITTLCSLIYIYIYIQYIYIWRQNIYLLYFI